MIKMLEYVTSKIMISDVIHGITVLSSTQVPDYCASPCSKACIALRSVVNGALGMHGKIPLYHVS
jgi:hypothetical protein